MLCLCCACALTQVCDFGLARFDGGMTGAGHTTTTAVVGTAQWTAPEVFLGQEHTTASDVYSFGIVVWEMCSLQTPFDGQSMVHVVRTCRTGRGGVWRVELTNPRACLCVCVCVCVLLHRVCKWLLSTPGRHCRTRRLRSVPRASNWPLSVSQPGTTRRAVRLTGREETTPCGRRTWLRS